jgi:hypothetical protein
MLITQGTVPMHMSVGLDHLSRPVSQFRECVHLLFPVSIDFYNMAEV